MKSPKHTIFFHLETTVRSYRQFAQARIDQAGIDLTIDQWLLLNAIMENNEITHSELVRDVAKDRASVTRILDLTVKKGYLTKESNPRDKRRLKLAITPAGKDIMEKMKPVVAAYRREALEHLTEKELDYMNDIITKIKMNIIKQEQILR